MLIGTIIINLMTRNKCYNRLNDKLFIALNLTFYVILLCNNNIVEAKASSGYNEERIQILMSNVTTQQVRERFLQLSLLYNYHVF